MPSQHPTLPAPRSPSPPRPLTSTANDTPYFPQNYLFTRNSPESKHSVGMSLAKRKQLAGGGGRWVPNIDSPMGKAELLICPKVYPSNCREGFKR